MAVTLRRTIIVILCLIGSAACRMHLDFLYKDCVVRVNKDGSYRSFILTSEDSMYIGHESVTRCYEYCTDLKKNFFMYNSTFIGRNNCFCLSSASSVQRHAGSWYGKISCKGEYSKYDKNVPHGRQGQMHRLWIKNGQRVLFSNLP